MRLYYEDIGAASSGENDKLFNGALAASVPVAVINYRHDLVYIPRTIARAKFPNIKQWSYHKTGGHFAAMEQPQEYVRDVEKFLLQLDKPWDLPTNERY